MNEFQLKRRWPRIAVSVKVTGEWWNRSGEGPHPLEAHMVRLSEGGAMLRCSAPIPANAVVQLHFRLGLLKRFSPRGTVRWWRRAGEVRELGVQFVDPIDALGKFVRDELARLKEGGGAAGD
ncbi:MAG: PilZ domain-containing protein [Myxococcales bacterium]